MAKTYEERKAADRERHRKTYEAKKDEIRAKNLARYYKMKEANPELYSKPRGRPKKVVETPAPAPVAEVPPSPAMPPVAPPAAVPVGLFI